MLYVDLPVSSGVTELGHKTLIHRPGLLDGSNLENQIILDLFVKKVLLIKQIM